MRGRGKVEYKYVSGNTSEHGGEYESGGIVLPLEIPKSKKINLSHSEYGFLHISCIVHMRIYQN